MVVSNAKREYKSSAAMTFEMGTRENRISASFVVEIFSRLDVRITSCTESHPYLCRGQVILNWSFPIRELLEQSVRTIFKSTFHMIEQERLLRGYELSVGMTTYEDEIKPLTWLRGFEDHFEECLYTCYALEQEEEIMQHLATRQIDLISE